MSGNYKNFTPGSSTPDYFGISNTPGSRDQSPVVDITNQADIPGANASAALATGAGITITAPDSFTPNGVTIPQDYASDYGGFGDTGSVSPSLNSATIDNGDSASGTDVASSNSSDQGLAALGDGVIGSVVGSLTSAIGTAALTGNANATQTGAGQVAGATTGNNQQSGGQQSGNNSKAQQGTPGKSAVQQALDAVEEWLASSFVQIALAVFAMILLLIAIFPERLSKTVVQVTKAAMEA